MTMKKMVKCPYHGDGAMASMFPKYIEYPFLCPWCKDKLEYEVDVSLYDYEGDFHSVDWNKIYDYEDDVWVVFKCDCGDEIHLYEGGDTRVCKCGRIYKLSVNVLVDHNPIKDTKELIEESNKR